MNVPVILVVDDDPDLRETLVDVLEESGYRALGAEHGRAALELLQHAHDLPDVILLDLMMPVMSGTALVGELRKDPRLADLPIVVFTAHPGQRLLASELSAAHSLTKPLELERLLSALATAIERSGGPHLANPP